MPRRFLIQAAGAAFLAVLAAFYFAGHNSRAPDTSLPAVDLAGFEPAVREQVQTALAAAQAGDAQAVGHLAQVLHSYGQYATAAQAYAAARAMEPDALAWAYLHGLTLKELGRSDAALAALRRATEQRADYLPAWLAVGEILLATDQAQIAEGLYRKLDVLKPESPVIHFGLARALNDRGDSAAAMEHFAAALAAAPYFAAAHYQLAMLQRDLGEVEKSRQHLNLYRRHQGKRPSHGDPLLASVQRLNQSPRQLAAQGKSAIVAGDLESAARLLEQAAALDEDYAAAHAALVFVYWQLGDDQRAGSHYRAAVAIAPDTPEAHLNYGMLMASRDELDQAAKLFARTLEVAPDNATAHTFLGFVEAQQGRGFEAERHYRKALALEPNQPRANYLLGRRLLNKGDAAQAEGYFAACVAQGGPESAWFASEIAAAYEQADNSERARHYLALTRTPGVPGAQ